MIAVLHNIRSVHNVGSIFRTADAAGIKKIYLCGYTPAPIDKFGRANEALAKVALNAEKYIEWQKVTSTSKLLDKLKNKDSKIKIFAVEQAKNSIPYYTIKNRDIGESDTVLVMGNELKGLSNSILKKVNHILEIPMHGKKESLNVSVAFGIVAFHFAHLKKVNHE